MAYEMVMPYHLHMPSYFLETFTEYPCVKPKMNMDATISAEPKFRLSGFRNANYFLAFQTCVFMCIMD